jgi:thioredoxin reductase
MIDFPDGSRLLEPGNDELARKLGLNLEAAHAGFATSMPGIFAAGDAPAGSTKQLGAAGGEGIAALIAIRRHLQTHSDLRRVEVNA